MLVLTICAALYKIIRPEAFATTSDLLVFPLLQNFLTFGCGLLLVNHHERDALDINKYSAAQKRMDVSRQFLGRAQTALYYLLPSRTRGIGGLARAAVATVLYGTAFVLCAVSLLIIAQMSVLMPSGVDAGADVFNAVVFAMVVGTSMGTLTGLFNFRLLQSYALRNWKASPGRAVRMRFMDFGMCLLAVALGVVYWTVIRDVFALGNAHAIAVPTGP